MQTIHKCLLMLTFLLLFPNAMNAQTAREFIEKGVELYDKGQFAEAVVQYEIALKMEPKNSTAHYEMATTLMSLEKYDAAIDHAQKVIKLKDGNEGLAYTVMGTAYDIMGKPKKAIKAYEDGIKLSPNDYNLYYNLAVTQYGQKDYDKAEINLMSSIKNNPKHANSHYALANVALQKDKQIKAMLPFYAYLRINPTGKKSAAVRESIENLFKKGVNITQNGEKNAININLSMFNDTEEFGKEEGTLSLKASLLSIPMDKKIKDSLKIVETPEATFFENTQTLFRLLSKKNRQATDSFWQLSYVNAFSDLFEANHLEAFCYTIYGNTEGSQKWQKEHAEKMTAYKEWASAKNSLTPMAKPKN